MQSCRYRSASSFMAALWLAVSLFTGFDAAAQVSDSANLRAAGNPRITWVSQFPATGAKGTAQPGKTSFFDVVFGKRNIPELSRPVGIAALNSARYWVLDQENGVFFQVSNQVGEIPHLRNKKFSRFPSLVGVCFFSGQRLLFTDSYLNKAFITGRDSKQITPLNDSLSLIQPTGIAYSPVTHEIWIVETGAHRIAVVSEEGKRLKTIGKRGTAPGEFNFPTSIWIDGSGRAYIVDALNFRVQVFSKDGELVSVFGKNGDGGGNFARPKGIATDSHGNIYVADALFNAVQVFDISGKFLYTFGSQGHGNGEFWMPSGVFIDNDDFIYIADSYNARIQVFRYQN